MFIAQLYYFLVAHHHVAWANDFFNGHMTPHLYARILHWAIRHGFVYQR